MSQFTYFNHWQPFYNLSDLELNRFIQSYLSDSEYNSIDNLNKIAFNQLNSEFDKFDSTLNPELNFFENSNMIKIHAIIILMITLKRI